jgi:hypothetical protein
MRERERERHREESERERGIWHSCASESEREGDKGRAYPFSIYSISSIYMSSYYCIS